jgi:hypothetical protein
MNILHRINKSALPLFRIDLKPATNNSVILNRDSLLHTKIKIELPNKNVPLLSANRAKLTFIQVTFATIHLTVLNSEITIYPPNA